MRAAILFLCLAVLSQAQSASCNKKSIASFRWIDGTSLSIRGHAFSDGPTYTRLPFAAKDVVRSVVWGESTQPAGLFIQFATDASCIFVNYTLKSSHTSMWHFPSTGMAGVDLYGWDAGNSTWRWTGTSSPSYPNTVGKLASLTCKGGCKERVYRLHLPTYAAVSSLSFGVNNSTKVFKTDSSQISSTKPIVWYGTSILQGGVASRPGQVNTHIVSRALQTEIFNFGFSGNGIMELSVAQFLAQINCSMFIIDCNPNMNSSLITERTAPLVQYLRSHGHAQTPIVLSEGIGVSRLFGRGPNML